MRLSALWETWNRRFLLTLRNYTMGIINIQNINLCLRTNSTVKDYLQGGGKRDDFLSKEPIDLQSRLKMKSNVKEEDLNDYDGYQILKPLAFLNNPSKTVPQFKLWTT